MFASRGEMWSFVGATVVSAFGWLFLLLDPPEHSFPVVFVVVIVGIQAIALVVHAFLAWQSPALAAVSVNTFVAVFTMLHFYTSASGPEAYSETLSKPDALYFMATTLSTTGFGDIVAVSTTARMLVTVQMVLGLTLVATILAAVIGALADRRTASLAATNKKLVSYLQRYEEGIKQIVERSRQSMDEIHRPEADETTST